MTEPLVLCGDGRNDSPGYSAQFRTYSFMDTRTNKIVSMEVVDSREADDKSVNMEKIGFTRALDDVITKCDQPVAEIVTDQHTQIRALMSELGPVSINAFFRATRHGALRENALQKSNTCK